MLSLVRILSPGKKLLREVSNEFFGTQLDRGSTTEALHFLLENHLLRRESEGYAAYHSAYLSKVITDYDVSDIKEDLSDLSELIAEDNDAQNLLSLSGYYKLFKNPKKAIEFSELALRQRPDYPEAYNNRAISKMSLNDLKGAISDLDMALSIRSDYGNALINRGIAKRRSGDLNGALDDYNQAVMLLPDSFSIYNNRSVVRRLMGDFEGALQDANRAIELDHNIPDAYNNRGNILSYNLGRFEEAIEDYIKALEISPVFRRH
jgi:tetratricopeptide (TPR) repeat protein